MFLFCHIFRQANSWHKTVARVIPIGYIHKNVKIGKTKIITSLQLMTFLTVISNMLDLVKQVVIYMREAIMEIADSQGDYDYVSRSFLR